MSRAGGVTGARPVPMVPTTPERATGYWNGMPSSLSTACDTEEVYLTKFIHQLVLESHPPHETVNLIFQKVMVNNRVTILWGILLSKTNE